MTYKWWNFEIHISKDQSSIQSLSRVRLFASPWTAAHQASLSINNARSLPKPTSIESVMSFNHLSSAVLFSSSPQTVPDSGSFQMSQLFTSGGQSIRVSASASVLQRTPRTDILYDGLVGSPCSSRDSQESSPTLQFKSINSRVLSFLYSPILTSIRDHWKNHSLDWKTFAGKVMSLRFNMQ